MKLILNGGGAEIKEQRKENTAYDDHGNTGTC